MAGRYRPRKEYKFWLFHDLNEDSRLMEYIAYLKSSRQFARVIRDGIRLIWSLREGNLTILFELFPHLERQFNPDAEDLIAEFREMLLANRSTPVQQPVMVEAVTGQGETKKSLASIQLALPTIEDDDDNQDTIVIKKVTGSSLNGGNLLSGIFGLD